MAADAPADTTALLRSARQGDGRAADLLFPHVYDELRRIAGRQVSRERDGHTLAATDLVHEAYLRLVRADAVEWADRAHFVAVAARAMRRILVNHARDRAALKRGGGDARVTLDAERLLDGEAALADDADRLLAVDAALDRLAACDADLGRLVELRFYGGAEVAEAAEVLGVSARTAGRMWVRARAHLHRLLDP